MKLTLSGMFYFYIHNSSIQKRDWKERLVSNSRSSSDGLKIVNTSKPPNRTSKINKLTILQLKRHDKPNIVVTLDDRI